MVEKQNDLATSELVQGELFTIQQVAEVTGLSSHTLRYYERIGLLTPIGRTSSGHRRYDQDDIRRIVLLNKMRKTGMPLEQIKEFSQLLYVGEDGIPGRITLLKTHREVVVKKMQELTDMLGVIDSKLETYQNKR
jgi:DNA-binding transcriptional MerR regulator